MRPVFCMLLLRRSYPYISKGRYAWCCIRLASSFNHKFWKGFSWIFSLGCRLSKAGNTFEFWTTINCLVRWSDTKTDWHAAEVVSPRKNRLLVLWIWRIIVPVYYSQRSPANFPVPPVRPLSDPITLSMTILESVQRHLGDCRFW